MTGIQKRAEILSWQETCSYHEEFGVIVYLRCCSVTEQRDGGTCSAAECNGVPQSRQGRYVQGMPQDKGVAHAQTQWGRSLTHYTCVYCVGKAGLASRTNKTGTQVNPAN